MKLSYNLASALWAFISEKWKLSHKTMYMNVHSSSILIAKKLKTARCPSMGDWLDKQEYIHAMEYYTAKNRNGLLIYTTT